MPKFVVFGGTGAQGGGVVRHLQAQGGYDIVVPTRNPESDKAVKLKNDGVSVVKCDQHNKDEVVQVMSGADYVFGITNFWDPQSMGKELELGKVMADVAKAANVKLFIWSSLVNADKVSGGKYNLPHLTQKAQVAEYCQTIGLPSVFVGAAFYYSNFRYFFPPQQTEDGLVFTLPMKADKLLVAFDAADMGKAVTMILEQPEKYMNRFVPVVGENKPLGEYIQDFAKATGKPAKLNEMPPDDYKKLGFPGAEELADMFQFFSDYGVFADEDLSLSPSNTSKYTDWLEVTGWKGEQ